MKNPFDDHPHHHDTLSDVFGNDPQNTDPNAHDSFQQHPSDFHDNSCPHDLHHDPFQSEWGVNHSEHPNNPGSLEGNPAHSNPADNFHQPESTPGHPDAFAPSEWDPGHSEHPEMPGSARSEWSNSENAHPPGDSEHLFHNNWHDPLSENPVSPMPHETDRTDILPDSVHQHSHDPNWMSGHDHHHTFGSTENSSVLHFESSPDHNKHPHITVGSQTGHVYLNDDKDIGRIDGHTVYNSADWNCGHWTTDGKVYDYHDHLVGWVHPDGHVYAKGSDGDLEVYRTEKGAAGGAAYLLLVWCGGQTHI